MKENKVNLHEKKTLSRIVASDQVQRVFKELSKRSHFHIIIQNIGKVQNHHNIKPSLISFYVVLMIYEI